MPDDDDAFSESDLPTHQLVAPGDEEGADLESDAVASELEGSSAAPHLDQIDDRDELSAEEEAMHLTDEPPMGDGDGYVA
jgi:hypothetical protein